VAGRRAGAPREAGAVVGVAVEMAEEAADGAVGMAGAAVVVGGMVGAAVVAAGEAA